ncbi:MAG: YoaK family protein [Hyphomonadaceae bacterium]
MLRYRRRYWLFAAALSTLAGFADANAFVHLGGYFVSFMSGNSTRLGVGLASHLDAARLAGGLIALFVLGVVVGALINRRGDQTGGVRVLACVTGLLALAALLAAQDTSIALLAIAMGAMNGVFVREGEVSIGVTYMTGTLVRMGQRLANALTGGKRWEWIPYVLLWSGLVLGATLGALIYGWIGLQSLWLAAFAAASLTIVLSRMPNAA